MGAKSLLKSDTLFYYLCYGLKGIGLYVSIYFISLSKAFTEFSVFLYLYSLFLILVPLLTFGIGNFLLRYAYSLKQQKQALTFFVLILSFEFLISFLLTIVDQKLALVFFWASAKSSFIAYESFLISKKNYFKISFGYILQVIGFVIISLLAIHEKIDDLYLLISLLACLELILLPFLYINFTFQNLALVFKSNRIIRRFYKFLPAMVLLTFLMSLYVNIDKILLGQTKYEDVLGTYGYLFLYIFSIHRFFTTPFIMRYSSIYYRSKSDQIDNRIIFKGILLIIFGGGGVASFFYLVQPSKFELGYLCGFTIFIISLYLINLQMLYLKKKLEIGALLSSFVKLVLVTSFLWMGYLYYFGVDRLEIVVALNSLIAVVFQFKSSKAVSLKLIYSFALVSFVFIGTRL